MKSKSQRDTANHKGLPLVLCPRPSPIAPHLDVDTTVRVRATVAAVSRPRPRVAPPVAMTTRVMMRRPCHIPIIPSTQPSTVPERKHGRDKKPNGVDDAKRPRRLEHRTRLRSSPAQPRARDGDVANIHGPVVAEADVGAVCVGDAAEVVDTRDETADEAEVNKGDEARVGRGAVVGEEGEDGPGEGEDGDDEEDEDRCGSEGVCFCVAVNEPGEHAHGGDLENPIVSDLWFTLAIKLPL